MDKEKNIKLARRVVLISGIFCGVVALLLLLNFWHMKQNEPLESKTIGVLMERLANEPSNEELKEEIRSFDLLARKAYFTSRWQVRTGTWLLLVGGIVLAVSLKIYTDLRSRIEEPEKVTEELLRARANSQYWLLVTGAFVLGLSLVAGILTNDYLKDYQEMGTISENALQQSDVELIEVFPDQPAAEGPEGDEASAAEADGTEANEGETALEAARGETEVVAEKTTSAVRSDREDFRLNQATFRGYMGQGVSYHKNIPVSWNGSTGENVKWKVAFSKPGYNTPVIWGDRIYISGGDKQSRIVACYNRHTGQLVWESEVKDIPNSPASPPRVTDDTGLAAPTMAVDGKAVYAIFATGDVVAFDMDGKLLWGRNLGVPNNHYGHSSSLMVWENKLVVQYDTNTKGRMLALDTNSGESIWDVDRPVHISWASPVLIEVEGKIQIITTSDPFVMGHDLDSGDEVWRVEAMMGEVGPSVAYEDGLVFATNEYARLVAVEPKPGTEYTWDDDGVLVCYDAKTGEKQWEMEFDEGFYSSPMIAEGKLYIIDLAGITHIIKTGREGTVISEPELGEGGYALPVFSDGKVYLRGESNLYCIGE
jgi:outer membrane protein assembly factor BamB